VRPSPRRFKKFLKNTFDHYSAILPARFPIFYRLVLRFLFAHVKFDERSILAIREASKKGPILYVARDKSTLEYLAFAWIFKQHKIPVPQFAHYVSLFMHTSFMGTLRRTASIIVHFLERRSYPNPYQNGYLAELLTKSIPTLLFVSHFRSLPRRFAATETDVLTEIFRCQRDLDRPIQVVPLVLIYGRKPDHDMDSMADLIFGPTAHPSFLRRLWMAFRFRKNLTLRVCEIDSLENMVSKLGRRSFSVGDASAEWAFQLRRRLIMELDEERHVVLGPIQKSRSEVIENTLHNPQLTRNIREYCSINEKSLVETKARCRRYLQEIAADYNDATVSLAKIFLGRWLKWGQGRVKTEAEGLDRVRRISRQMPLVYVPCHKSHLDYLLVSYTLYLNQLSLPRILSGVNLNRFPIGGIFRKCGAFFLRRSFKGKRIYSQTVVAYIETLLRDKINLEFFVEGGRSRIGKVIPPKLGFIGILFGAFRQSARKDLAFVPVTIDYERVFEERLFLEEAAGKKISKNKLNFLIKNRRIIRRRVGDVDIEFGEPIKVKQLLVKNGFDEMPAGRADQMKLAADMAYRITWGINQNVRVRPYAVLATALLATPRKGILLPDLENRVSILVEFLRSRKVRIAGSLWKQPDWPVLLLDLAVREKFARVEIGDLGYEDTIVFLDDDRRLNLTIHRNSILHFYQEIALISVVFSSAGKPKPTEELFESFVFLKNLLSNEMIYSPSPEQTPVETRKMFDKAWKYFSAKDLIARSDRGDVLTAEGMETARLFAGILISYLESYYVVARTCWKYRGQKASDKEWIKRIMKNGRALYGLGEITYPEALHKLHFEMSLNHFSQMGFCIKEEKLKHKHKVDRNVTYKIVDDSGLDNIITQIRKFMQTG